jgi:hypothetical protein
MVTTKERTEQRAELVSQGYSWEYIDAWQPKITLYRHAPILSEGGEVVRPIGTKVENLPGNPDYVLRKSVLGMLPYPPSDTCECRWCSARKVDVEIPVEPEKIEPQESVTCQDCGEMVHAVTKAGALSRLRVHVKTHQGVE